MKSKNNKEMGGSMERKTRKRVTFEKFFLSMVDLPQEAIERAKKMSTLDKTQEEVLIDLNYITEAQFAELVAIYTGLELIDLENFESDKKAIDSIEKSIAQQQMIFPVSVTDEVIKVAMFNPLNSTILNDIRLLTQRKVEPVIAVREDIKKAILTHYSTSKKIEDELDLKRKVNVQKKANTIVTDTTSNSDDSPVVKLVNSIIEEAADRKASDIHFDPLDDEMVVRIRIDGTLIELMRINLSVMPMVISRIKIMSDLNISENRLPQDGRVRIQTTSHLLDLRISTLPTIHGEKIVMRVIDLSGGTTNLDKLGFTENNYSVLKKNIEAPYGLVLITGPTGSGKTSTLYSILNEVNHPGTNIITVEDPVEQQLEGINQVQVNQQIDLTFASGLRSILRQDPNVVMVGEIRDAETAEMAIQASLTGHMVLSTLHTNDSISSIIRLIDMGVAPFLVSNALSAVVAQRLVRKTCAHCQKEEELTQKEKDLFERQGVSCTHQMVGTGCNYCNYSGYDGRLAIQEVLKLSNNLRTLISSEVELSKLREVAVNQGFSTMLVDGLRKVRSGHTTVSEVLHAVKEN